MTKLTDFIESSNVCSLPWVHTEINLQNNSISPCCKYRAKLGDAADGFNVIWFGPHSNKLRTDMLNNVTRHECIACNNKEGAFTYKDWKNKFYREIEILDNVKVYPAQLPKVFHFSLSNVCNLTCRMCNPASSSRINSLASDQKFSKFFKPVVVNNKFPIEKFSGSFKNAEYITISGGEPLVNTDCVNLIDLISRETTNLKAIAFSTNMTVINKQLLVMLSKLNAEVKFNISIDGPPRIQEYIREGCKWSDIVENIKFIADNYPNFKFGVNTTISALNVGYIPELLESIRCIQDICNIKFVEIQPSPVFNDYLHIGVLPEDIRSQYRNKLTEISTDLFFVPSAELLVSTALNFLNQDTSSNFCRFVEFIQVFDNAVGTDIKRVYPEFSNLF